MQAADRDVAAAIAARYPRLSLSASLSAAASAPAQLLQGWAASLVAGVVAPLFDGGQRKADVQRARAQLTERVQSYAETVLTALAEVEDALASEAKQRDLLTSLDRQLALASDVLVQVEGAYAAGMSDYLKVIDAIESVQSLQRQRLQAQSDLVQTRIALCRALAGSWALTRPADAG